MIPKQYQEALKILNNAASQARMTKQEHMLAQQAHDVILKALEDAIEARKKCKETSKK